MLHIALGEPFDERNRRSPMATKRAKKVRGREHEQAKWDALAASAHLFYLPRSISRLRSQAWHG